MVLRGTGWGGMDWIDLAKDGDRWRALVNTVMNLRVPKNRKFLGSYGTGGFPIRAQLHGVSSHTHRYLYITVMYPNLHTPLSQLVGLCMC
jgi:hypothetical protein